MGPGGVREGTDASWRDPWPAKAADCEHPQLLEEAVSMLL